MDIFSECTRLVQRNSPSISDVEAGCTEKASMQAIHSTVPAVVSQAAGHYDALDIYYISDLHLVHHMLDSYPAGATDEQIAMFVHGIVLRLLSGDVSTKIRRFKSPVILFGGDVSSSYKLAHLFYTDFVRTWDLIREDSYSHFSEMLGSIEFDLNSCVAEIDDWKEKHPWIKQAAKPLSEYTDKAVPRRIKDLLEKRSRLSEQMLKIQKDFEIGYFWRNDYERAKRRKFIYAILGNHEL